MGRKDNLKKAKTKTIILGIVAIVAILAVALTSYTMAVKKNVNLWANKIYPGIRVNGIDLSGKTKEEAQKELYNTFNTPIQNKILTVKAGGQEFKLKYNELKPKLSIDDTINKALKEGKTGNIFSENQKIKNGCNTNIDLGFSYDKSKVNSFENKIRNNVDKKPKNATLSLEGSSPAIIDGEIGKEVNKKQLNELVAKNINDDLGKNPVVEAVVEDIQPKVKRSDLEKIDGIIGSFSTSFATSDENRSANLRIATNAVNGTILMPGQEFSYNDTLGERTRAKGYRSGAVFINNKVVDDVGGGICQISTTLYRAAMRAGIKSTERHNHSMKTSYSPLGLDATVAWGSLDYKFKNPYNFPIYIEGYTTPDKQVEFNIYGNVEAMQGKTHELGAGHVSNNGGSSTVTSYLTTYQNGKEINKEKIATDTYKN